MGESPNPLGPAAELFGQAAADLEAARAAVVRREPVAAPGASPEDRLRDLMRHARAVTSILDLQLLLDAVVQAFVEITGAERGFLMLYDATGTLQPSARSSIDPAWNAERDSEISRGPISDAATSGQGVYVEDVLTQGQYGARDSVLALRLRSFNCVPLVHGGRVLGVCYTDSRQPGRVLASRDRTLLEAFASQAALAIDNARRHGEVVEAKSRLEHENEGLRRQIERRYRFTNILGESPVMERLFETLEKVAPHAVNVLLIGETGTGKELLARALHVHGPLHDAPFIPVNVGAMPEALLESELFGHRKGGFTGAIEDRRGLFEEADGGTLFLDEVGEMPPTLQVKLLRVLQEGELRRVGETAVRSVQVRIVAATNRDLAAEVRAGRFREDLYYRLNVVGIRVPPLRERGNDILLLAEDCVRRFAKKHAKKIAGIAPEAGRWLLSKSWEGNVRELQNCVERAVTLCEPGRMLSVDLLGDPWAVAATPATRPRLGTLHETLDAVEKLELQAALDGCEGCVTDAAERLGVSRQHLHTLMRKHRLVGVRASKRRLDKTK